MLRTCRKWYIFILKFTSGKITVKNYMCWTDTLYIINIKISVDSWANITALDNTRWCTVCVHTYQHPPLQMTPATSRWLQSCTLTPYTHSWRVSSVPLHCTCSKWNGPPSPTLALAPPTSSCTALSFRITKESNGQTTFCLDITWGGCRLHSYPQLKPKHSCTANRSVSRSMLLK